MPGAKYEPIKFTDLHQFLKERDFKEINTPYKERVYAREDYCGKMLVSIQLYTSLAKQHMLVREVGKDALRLIMKGRDVAGVEHILNKPKRLNRVTGWRGKLNLALLQWQKWIQFKCPCGTPLTFVNPHERGAMHCSYCKEGL